MGIDTETSTRFFTRMGRTIRHLEKHQGIAMDFHYLDTESGREFDVRELPGEYMGVERNAVMGGERSAHRTVITRAIDGDYHFVVRRT